MDIHELLRDPVDMDTLAGFLDSLHHEGRVEAIRDLSGSEQSRLFEAARGFRKITIDDLVPPQHQPLAQVIHYGKNSLPVFNRFEKRLCRPDAGPLDELWGYNEFSMKTAVGPGYFVAYDLVDGEVLIDYLQVPPHGAPGWPKVLPNSARLSRFVYNGTQDTLRGVSEHVSIGRAARDGEPMPNWFVLCRETTR